MKKYDVIVIGAGLGGLTTAAYLAKKGKKVLVLEQHNIVGGAATCFKRHDMTFEVGLHEMDFGDQFDMKHIIFNKLELWDKISLVKIPQTWAIKSDKEYYSIPKGHDAVKAYLKDLFPKESKGIDRMFYEMKNTVKNNGKLISDMSLLEFFVSPFISLPFALGNILDQSNVGDKLDSFFTDPKLKNLLCANIAYYGEDPYSLSWAYFASAQYAYYHSAYYVKGGSQNLSNALADIIMENGGHVQTMANVVSLDTVDNKITFVTYTDKKTQKTHSIPCNHVVSNISPENINIMLKPQFAEKRTVGLNPAISLYTVSIIFKKRVSEIYPDMAYSTFLGVGTVLEKELITIENTYRSPYIGRDKGCVFVNYDAIDSGLLNQGDERSFGVLSCTSHIAEWVSLSNEEYKVKKQNTAEALIKLLIQHYPLLEDQIEYFEVSTPKTIRRYLKTPNGSPYGYKNQGYIWKRIGWKLVPNRSPRKSSTIKNLHYTGAWAFPGGGFTGAMISGYIAGVDVIMSLPIRILIKSTLLTVIIIIFVKILRQLIN